MEGLPLLFSQRVKTRLKNKNDGVIPWHECIYREIATEIVAEGADLCNTLKIQKQLSEERSRGKLALGDFYEQYGFAEIPKAHHRHKSRLKDSRYKDYKRSSRFKKRSKDTLDEKPKKKRYFKRKSGSPKYSGQKHLLVISVEKLVTKVQIVQPRRRLNCL